MASCFTYLCSCSDRLRPATLRLEKNPGCVFLFPLLGFFHVRLIFSPLQQHHARIHALAVPVTPNVSQSILIKLVSRVLRLTVHKVSL